MMKMRSKDDQEQIVWIKAISKLISSYISKDMWEENERDQSVYVVYYDSNLPYIN